MEDYKQQIIAVCSEKFSGGSCVDFRALFWGIEARDPPNCPRKNTLRSCDFTA